MAIRQPGKGRSSRSQNRQTSEPQHQAKQPERRDQNKDSSRRGYCCFIMSIFAQLRSGSNNVMVRRKRGSTRPQILLNTFSFLIDDERHAAGAAVGSRRSHKGETFCHPPVRYLAAFFLGARSSLSGQDTEIIALMGAGLTPLSRQDNPPPALWRPAVPR